MVRQTKFSFDEGMDVSYPQPEEEFDDDDLDEFVVDRARPVKRRHRHVNRSGIVRSIVVPIGDTSRMATG